MSTLESFLDAHQAQYVQELLGFLEIPSISALPAHADDVQRAAAWVANRLQAAGLEHVEILPTGGHPVVYADYLHAPGKPIILIYGHFDTQPADPLDLWTSPPFEPTLREDRVYARGASDDKGNMLIPILAVEALLSTEGSVPVNVKFFFEGQEEIGSPQIPAFLQGERQRFACDLVVSSDGSQWSEDTPSLFLGGRGLCAMQIDVQGARVDLHSGMYGGAVANPIHALVQILDSMRGQDGVIRVQGFYDHVRPLTDQERAAIAAVPFDEEAFMAPLGVDELVGEPGFTPVERMWARPTLEVNGIWGGFQGDGVKTVLPAEAHAKITCRLVPDQDPQHIVRELIAHVERHAPPGVQVTARQLPGTAVPYLIPATHWGNVVAAEVLKEVYGREPYATRTGGSIPVCDLFRHMLGAYTVGFAFGLDDEGLHSPNEFFRLRSFRRGQTAYTLLLERLATAQQS
jgi:acetylornithine deacetylase/succinyl-diaminopimelate desuccinylase-like protein